ncbi:MAG: penicillin-binding protein [Bacteroidota bacterium]|nr:transpeptidase family protein [Sphingobacteriales bacterium]
MATNIRKVILIRTYTAFAFVAVFAMVIVAYLFKIQYLEKKHWLTLADHLSTSIQTVEPSRGNIFAADGSLLATSLPIYDLRLDGKAPAFADEEIFTNQLDSLAYCLATEFEDRSKAEYKRILSGVKNRGDRYYLLKRKVSYTQMKRVKQFPIFREGKYKGGLTIEEKNRREKPFDYLAERTIGYSVKGIAPVGIEGAFDKELAGKPGKRVMQRIAGGTWIPVNDEEQQIEARNGLDVVSTIDVNLQDVAEQALLNTLMKNNAEWGTAILMEVKTGEIKAIANLTRVTEGQYTEKYNYAVGESLEPGSTFKITSMMALLEDDKAQMTDMYDTEGGKKKYFANATMYDAEEGGHGLVNFQQAFEISSNVAISKAVFAAYKNNPEKFYNHLKRLKLTDPIGIQLSGEGKPRIKHPRDKDWYGTTLPWSSIGYEVKVTPLQMVTLYNALANNGRMVKPVFVKQILKTGKPVKEFKTSVMVEQVCKPSTLKNLYAMMKGVVEHGTATNLKNPNYTVAGKTGTALVADGRLGYAKQIYRSSFVGFFPADQPKYTCMVMVNAPSNGIYYGSLVAGPVFKELADKVYATSTNLHKELKYVVTTSAMQLPPAGNGYAADLKAILDKLSISSQLKSDSEEESGSEWAATEVQQQFVKLHVIKSQKNVIPDVKGMGLKDAIYLLENAGLRVQTEGYGKVKFQSINPGVPATKGATINLRLG